MASTSPGSKQANEAGLRCSSVTKKIGVTASVGLEFKILKIGGEVTAENEYKRGFEQEVEAGVNSFKGFKPA